MRNIIEEGKQRLGIGNGNLPFGATRKGQEQLRWMQEVAPDRVAVAEVQEPIGTGLFGGRFRRRTKVLRVTAQVNEFPQDHAEGALTGRILPPEESVGKLVRLLGGGGKDAQLPRSAERSPEAETIRTEIAKRHPYSFKNRLLVAASIVRGKQEVIEKAIEDTERVAEGVAVRRSLNEQPIEARVTGLGGLVKTIIGGGTWGNSVEVTGRGQTWRVPRGETNVIDVAHEDIRNRTFIMAANPPKWLDKIISTVRVVTGKTIKSPIGTVQLFVRGMERPIASVTVRHPEDFVEDLQTIASKADQANIQPRDIPAPLKIGDLL